MEQSFLPFDTALEAYEGQAAALLAAHGAGDPEAIRVLHAHLPRFLRTDVPWLPRRLAEGEIAGAALTLDDARLAVARAYCFRDWEALRGYVASLDVAEVRRFEAAVEAVIGGDEDRLRALLPFGVVGLRSRRETHFDPPVHGATLLHYLVANGVENYRQKTPPNAVAIARMVLEAGADPNALAALYGGQCSVMSMLVSSSHPAQAGVQVALVDLLVDFGASVEAFGEGNWTSPVVTALVFGFVDAAEALVRRGARVDDIVKAAGLGRVDLLREMLPSSSGEERQKALALATQLGRVDVTAMLLDAGADPDAFHPAGFHAHATPLHHAALHRHDGVVRLLVERGARLDIGDRTYGATPAGWAAHGGYEELAAYLRR